MATAAAMCRPHASEARRPEAGSRAVGVSRAERGNDGSPKGRDAAGGSMRSTTARPAMFPGRGRPFNQRWTYRLDALDEMLLVRKGFCVCPAGQRYRAVPSTAPQLGARHRHRALQKKARRPEGKSAEWSPHGHCAVIACNG